MFSAVVVLVICNCISSIVIVGGMVCLFCVCAYHMDGEGSRQVGSVRLVYVWDSWACGVIVVV